MAQSTTSLDALLAAEEKLVAAARNGEVCDLTLDAVDEREVRADVLVALVLGKREEWRCEASGVRVTGASITGPVDLSSSSVSLPLMLRSCAFGDTFSLADARTHTIDLTDSTLPGLDARGVTVDGDLVLSGVTSDREVTLMHANVAGYVVAEGGTFGAGPREWAVNAEALHVGGSLWLRRAYDVDGASRAFHATGGINLLGARIDHALDLSGAELDAREGYALMADSLDVGDAAFLRSVDAHGVITLFGAKVGQSLDLSGADVAGMARYALDLTACEVRGALMLRPWPGNDGAPRSLRVVGGVGVAGASVGRVLDLEGAQLENPYGEAFMGDSVQVGGAAFFRFGFRARGGVNLVGARVGQSLDFSGADIERSGAFALAAPAAEIKGSAYLRAADGVDGEPVPFRAAGGVNLNGTNVALSLDFAGAELVADEDLALQAQGIRVGGTALFSTWYAASGATLGFRSSGRLDLSAAHLGRLDFTGAFIENEDGHALVADSLDVVGSAFFRDGFTARGPIHLLGARVGQSLDFSGAQLEGADADGDTLTTESADVGGALHFRPRYDDEGALVPFRSLGTVNLTGARVGQDAYFVGAQIGRPAAEGSVAAPYPPRPSLLLTGLSVTGDLVLRGFGVLEGDVSLVRARAGRLSDDQTAWPAPPHRLHLDGFVYEAFGLGAATGVAARVAWLERQAAPEIGADGNPGGTATQPYEQLAHVYDRMGDERSARRVRVTKHRAMRHQANVPLRERAWSWFLDVTMLYGYAAYRSLVLGLVMVVGGWFVFHSADIGGVMRPAVDDAPPLQPLVYSLDSFLPVIDLHQEVAWTPAAHADWEPLGLELGGAWVQWYLWAHIALGWIVTTLAVAALTGLVRRT